MAERKERNTIKGNSWHLQVDRLGQLLGNDHQPVMVDGKSRFSGWMAVTPSSSEPDQRSTSFSISTCAPVRIDSVIQLRP